MPASEKLKAMNMKFAWYESEASDGEAFRLVPARLADALPQIVAVVEAAEEHQIAARARWTSLKNEGEPLTLREYHQTATALSALEEALP